MGKSTGKIAVMTGGTSGIGLASARKFVAEGAYVFLTGRRQPELDAALDLLGGNAARPITLIEHGPTSQFPVTAADMPL